VRVSGVGTVYLVGAGPGDPGLITRRGADVLSRCEAVVYDTLVNPVILALAPAAAERIDVGKKPGHAPTPQEEITALLVRLARAGKTVVRLKGGDPFVFGRGGEEALGLVEAGVRFEVVPGVTAAPAAAAYAGIPITHRGLTSTFALVTGHEDPDKDETDVDWPALARMGTVALYMGVKNLPRIVERLISAGLPATTPAAVVASGTYPHQKSVFGTLADIAGRAAAAGVHRPAMTIVGKVAALGPKLAWFEKRPLFGRTVLVTRARDQASEFAAALAEFGANVIEAPVIEFRAPADWTPVDRAIRSAGEFDWVVFTSVNGVAGFFDRLDALGLDIRTLGRAKLAAIGPATAAELRRRHLAVDFTPKEFVAEALLEEMPKVFPIAGRSFLLPRADIARPALPDGLRAAGAKPTVVEMYRTVRADRLPEPAVRALEAGVLDWVTFTSSSTVRHFAELAGPALLARAKEKCRFASIGPITSATAKELGIPVHVEAAEHTIAGLTAAVRGAAGK
jgi:uroporphyrinogen III methyltransferase/synthase